MPLWPDTSAHISVRLLLYKKSAKSADFFQGVLSPDAPRTGIAQPIKTNTDGIIVAIRFLYSAKHICVTKQSGKKQIPSKNKTGVCRFYFLIQWCAPMLLDTAFRIHRADQYLWCQDNHQRITRRRCFART